MICFIHLQAAMGLGVVLLLMGFFLFCVVFPASLTLFYKRILTRRQKAPAQLKTSDYVFVFVEALVYSVVVIISLSLLLLALLWFAMKDVVFM